VGVGHTLIGLQVHNLMGSRDPSIGTGAQITKTMGGKEYHKIGTLVTFHTVCKNISSRKWGGHAKEHRKGRKKGEGKQ